jgi:hypothetical protein
MAKIVTQLGKSKKYANGSIHENATGQFQVVDRFLSNEGIVMLKIEWLTGEKAGQFEENREENINASIYKYEQSRGLLGHIEENNDVVSLRDIYNTAQECCRILKWYEQDRKNIQNNLQLMEERLHVQTELILSVQESHKHHAKRIENLTDLGDKNNEMIKEIGMMLERNNTLLDSVNSKSDLISNQQALMDKLIEKIK